MGEEKENLKIQDFWLKTFDNPVRLRLILVQIGIILPTRH